MSIGERLKAERMRLRMTPPDFGQHCGVGRTTQFAYENEGDRSPDAEYLRRAAELGVDVRYVITGERTNLEADYVVVPQYEVAASAGGGAVNSQEEPGSGLSFSRAWLAKRGLNPANLSVINVSGESMEGKLSDGDKVLVDISETRPKSGRAYVLLQGEELLVKYCQLLPDGLLRVSSENEHYPTYDIDLARTDGVSIVGRVVASTHEW